MPVPPKIVAARQARFDAKRRNAAAVVPYGPYCYAHTGRMVERSQVIGPDGDLVDFPPYQSPEIVLCPYWKRRGDWARTRNGERSQRYGYCRLTKMGDQASHPSKQDFLLWDQCKSCGINDDDDTCEGGADAVPEAA
jgi:hypothetical protein